MHVEQFGGSDELFSELMDQYLVLVIINKLFEGQIVLLFYHRKIIRIFSVLLNMEAINISKTSKVYNYLFVKKISRVYFLFIVVFSAYISHTFFRAKYNLS